MLGGMIREFAETFGAFGCVVSDRVLIDGSARVLLRLRFDVVIGLYIAVGVTARLISFCTGGADGK